MINFFWLEFGILFAAGLVGALAVMPYGLQLMKSSKQGKPLKMSVPVFLLLSFFQSGILLAIAIGIGLLAARAIGLGVPYVEAFVAGKEINSAVWTVLQTAVAIGVLGGLALLLMDLIFLPYLPELLLDTARKISLWQNFAASFYGGLNEEMLMRLFGLSVFAWLLSRIWHTSAGLPTDAVFWIANLVMTVLFGLGHLPVAKKLLGRITPLMFIRTLLLNSPVGFACGWLFWRYGLEAAVVAHFATDIVYHVGGTIVLRLYDRYRLVRQTRQPT